MGILGFRTPSFLFSFSSLIMGLSIDTKQIFSRRPSDGEKDGLADKAWGRDLRDRRQFPSQLEISSKTIGKLLFLPQFLPL